MHSFLPFYPVIFRLFKSASTSAMDWAPSDDRPLLNMPDVLVWSFRFFGRLELLLALVFLLLLFATALALVGAICTDEDDVDVAVVVLEAFAVVILLVISTEELSVGDLATGCSAGVNAIKFFRMAFKLSSHSSCLCL